MHISVVEFIESFKCANIHTIYRPYPGEVVVMGLITARKVGRRMGSNSAYPIIYIPREINAFLNLKPGDKVVIYMPDSADHFEVWPMHEFIKRRNEGKI